MAGVSKFLRRLFNVPKLATVQPFGPDFSRFAEGDRVLVDGKKLSGPLQTNHRLELPRGYIAHNDIIGQRPRAVVATNVGQKHQITYPNLDQYISLTPRKVTPVYASYASLIVSLLDIHATAPTATNENDDPLEILESGTGHGALTLHLAKAVHASNPPPPFLPPPKQCHAPLATTTPESPREHSYVDKESQALWTAYNTSRRAIVHSVEISPTYAAHAQKLIHQFRRGIYAPHVDFHVASIDEWIRSQLHTRRHNSSLFRKSVEAEPFLSHVILDMPGCHLHIETVVPAMKDGALLVVFVPSVTQIGDCVRVIQDKVVQLQMEKVLELGEGISNGRIWDVRLARKRARSNDSSTARTENQALDEKSSANGGIDAAAKDIVGNETERLQSAEVEPSRDEDSVMVCRPKVGRMTVGGGFIGLWRKLDSPT